jgi:leucyl aminopeptidase
MQDANARVKKEGWGRRSCPPSPAAFLEDRRVKYYRELDCLCGDDSADLKLIHAVRPEGLEAWLSSQRENQANFVRGSGFTAASGQIALLPSEEGCCGAVLGLGVGKCPHVFGALPGGLPPGTDWCMASGIEDEAACVLGFCLGAYRAPHLKTSDGRRRGARLALSADARARHGVRRALSAARAAWLARDLINLPANLLWPEELAAIAGSVLSRNGAHVNVITGENLAQGYPAVHAVGRGSVHKPAVLIATWQSSSVTGAAPCVSVCGKGACFDTGGYDLKPPAGMLRMKKDMGGAAIALGLACMIIDADLPCRLELRLGCVENMISGDAMRPLDILQTRKGISVEVGNTDAEGRLVLCDLLADASESRPSLLMDFATLTGAARVALGPDLPALFSNDEALATIFTQAARDQHDPVWRLPLWEDYNYWLDSDMADVNNVSEKSHAGAIVAGLFLQRFVPDGVRWVHFDVYSWNDTARPGRPAGGEAQAMRAAFEGISHVLATGHEG